MSKQKVWIVSEVFYPEEVATGYIMTEIALAVAGDCEVHVICGPESYERKKENVDYSRVSGIKIHRISWFNFNKNKLVLRLLRFLGLSLGMFFMGLWLIRKRDKVLIVTNPAPVIPMYALLHWLKGFQFLILVHDVFPENLVTGGMLSARNLLYKILKGLFDRSYKAASHLIVLGRDMRTVMLQKTNASPDKVTIIPNWADLEHVSALPFATNEVVLQHKLEHKIVIQYAGNHGRLQHLPEFLELVAQVRNDLLHFVFIGNGAMKQQMMDYVAQKKLENVSFWQPFGRKEQNIYLNACHIGLVSLSDELFGLGVPSKSYNILASAKPVLFMGNKDTEIGQLIGEEQCGFVFAHSAKEEVLAFLNNLTGDKLGMINEMGQKGKRLAEEQYAKPIILEQFRNLLLEPKR
jgi:glycosyltransferase involved in cell wall biosynthesis